MLGIVVSEGVLAFFSLDAGFVVVVFVLGGFLCLEAWLVFRQVLFLLLFIFFVSLLYLFVF